MKSVICDICGKEFTATGPNTRYCSLECSAIGRSYTRRLWMEDRTGYMKDYMREYRSKQKTKS